MLRLGGLMMSFLGCIGHLMCNSGISDRLYNNNLNPLELGWKVLQGNLVPIASDTKHQRIGWK